MARNMRSSLLDLMEGKISSTNFLFGDIGLPESKCVFINFSFGAKHVTPRSLSAHFIGNMVCVEGIVTKCKSSFLKFIVWNGIWNS